MTGNADIFNMLMAKYRLNDPLSPEQQTFVIKSRKKVFKAILKKYKKYSIFLWLVVATALFFRSLGIKLTFIQSKVILALALSATTAGASVGAYAGAQFIHKKLGYVMHIDRKVSLYELYINLRVDETTPVPETDSISRTVTLEAVKGPQAVAVNKFIVFSEKQGAVNETAAALVLVYDFIEANRISPVFKNKFIDILKKDLSNIYGDMKERSTVPVSSKILKGSLTKTESEYILSLDLVTPDETKTASLQYKADTPQKLMVLTPKIASDIKKAGKKDSPGNKEGSRDTKKENVPVIPSM